MDERSDSSQLHFCEVLVEDVQSWNFNLGVAGNITDAIMKGNLKNCTLYHEYEILGVFKI